MHESLKKPSSSINAYLKKSRKIISIFVVFLLLSTILSTIVLSDSNRFNSDTKDEDLENNFTPTNPIKKLLESGTIREGLRSLRERLTQLRNGLLGIKEEETVQSQVNTRGTDIIFSRTLNSLIK